MNRMFLTEYQSKKYQRQDRITTWIAGGIGLLIAVGLPVAGVIIYLSSTPGGAR